MKYGYFDTENREYVITNPKTPVKWINYIGTLSFGGFVDHTGGALICKGDPALNRITKYIPQLPASDFKGETLYIRIKIVGGYRVFTPFYSPCLVPFEEYECRVGLGYSRFISTTYGIEVDVTVFVPQTEEREIRLIRVTNKSDVSAWIDAIPVVEYTHFDALKQYTNADWVPQTMQSAYKEEAGCQILTQYAFMLKDTHINFFTASHPVSSFETDRQRFLGDHGYGGWANPLSLQDEKLSNYESRRGDNIGALLLEIGELKPGESHAFITQLGQASSLELEFEKIAYFNDIAVVEEALREQKRYWDDYLSKFQVDTPDVDLNTMVNIHNAYQCYITLNWSRYLSLYQLGLGARGIGTRDSSQDVMGVLHAVPSEAKRLLRKLLQVQKSNGSSMHQFNPLTMEGSVGDSREREDRPKYYSDDHLWGVLAVAEYLKETGDHSFLQEVIPFYDKDKDEKAIEFGSVWEHMCRAIGFTYKDRGSHGLPLLGFADWNDTINLAIGAESAISACLYGKALLEMVEIASIRGAAEEEKVYRGYYDEINQVFNAQAWDGEWYISYFDADGSPMGSKENEAAQIYAYGQSWPVIAGFSTGERMKTSLDVVYEWLHTGKGIKLSTPGFNGFNPEKGGITTYPPGAKENCGIFLHVNPWVMIAECMNGNGDRAYLYYQQTNPAGKNDLIDEYECEPYVYPQNILSDEHPQFGLARNSWLSGTASWMYQAVTKSILGIRPTHWGLLIDPCIPSAWDGYSVKRAFRGTMYEIVVENPAHVCQGVQSILLDGVAINGNVLPLLDDGEVHQVHVILGQ